MSASTKSSYSDNSSSSSSEDGSPSAVTSWPAAERITPSLLTQEDVEALCGESYIPTGCTVRPAGDLRVCSPPPPDTVFVYAHVLEAGFCRASRRAFYCKVLGHFGLAPSQLTPNGWGLMAHFYKLCRSAAVRPSLTLFRHLFSLCNLHRSKGWYFFRSSYKSLREGLPPASYGWKEDFFLLSSPEPWTCPVVWGEPSEESKIHPALKCREMRAAKKKLLPAPGSDSVVVQVKTEPCSDIDTPECSPSPKRTERKRSLDLEEVRDVGTADGEAARKDLLQAMKKALELQENLVARERDAAAESRALEERMKKLTAELNEAKEAAKLEREKVAALQKELDASAKAGALREEMKKLAEELSQAKEAVKLEREKAGSLRMEVKKLTDDFSRAKEAAMLESGKAGALREEMKKLMAELGRAKATAKLEREMGGALREEVKKLKVELSQAKETAKMDSQKAATLLEELKAVEAKDAELGRVKEDFDIYLS